MTEVTWQQAAGSSNTVDGHLSFQFLARMKRMSILLCPLTNICVYILDWYMLARGNAES